MSELQACTLSHWPYSKLFKNEDPFLLSLPTTQHKLDIQQMFSKYLANQSTGWNLALQANDSNRQWIIITVRIFT